MGDSLDDVEAVVRRWNPPPQDLIRVANELEEAAEMKAVAADLPPGTRVAYVADDDMGTHGKGQIVERHRSGWLVVKDEETGGEATADPRDVTALTDG